MTTSTLTSSILPSQYRALDLPADAWALVDAGHGVVSIENDGKVRYEVRDRRGVTLWPPPNDFEWSTDFPTRDGVFYFYGTTNDSSPPSLHFALVSNRLVVIDGVYVRNEPPLRGLFARVPPPASIPTDAFSVLSVLPLPSPSPDGPVVHAVRAGKTICGAELRPGETFGRPGQHTLVSCQKCRA